MIKQIFNKFFARQNCNVSVVRKKVYGKRLQEALLWVPASKCRMLPTTPRDAYQIIIQQKQGFVKHWKAK